MEIPRLFFVERRERGRIRVTGKERQTFLQGMVTNDVARLTPGQGCYAFMLDATGHVLADMRIIVRENDLLLDVEPGKASFVMETLDKYLIMEKARFTNITIATVQFLLGGEGLADVLKKFGLTLPSDTEGANSVTIVEDVDVTLARSHWMRYSTYDLYVNAGAEEIVWDILDAEKFMPLTEDDLDTYRIEAGIPRFGVDIDSRVLAPETGQTARAVSYKKGCYIGQEIVARIDARGHTNRGFAQFLLDTKATLPEKDAPVTIDGKDVGRITSATKAFALGYLRHEYAAPGTVVTIAGQSAVVADRPV